MLISPAFAQAAGGGGGFGGLGPLLPLVLIFVVFYFLLIRPQQKKQKAHREMLTGLRRGDRVVTSGGIIGKIIKVPGDSELVIEIAEGVRVRVMRSMVADMMATDRGRDDSNDNNDDDNDDGDDDDDEDAPKQASG